MMITKHPSCLPFEFIACGGWLVSSRDAINTWLLKDGENCMPAPAGAPGIARQLALTVEQYVVFDQIRRRGQGLIRARHSDWDAAFEEPLRFIDPLTQSP
jgi:hypothetical protein